MPRMLKGRPLIEMETECEYYMFATIRARVLSRPEG
jgi:hypothetical protein